MREFEIETDIENIKRRKRKKDNNIRTKVIRKHSLSEDTIFNGSANELNPDDETYIIPGVNSSNNQDYQIDDSVDNSHNYNSSEYYKNNKMRNQIYNLLKENSDIKFGEDEKRKFPSKSKLNEYFEMLVENLKNEYYTHLEIFISLSEYFTDMHFNSYKRLSSKNKELVYRDLAEKYDIEEIEMIDFI